MPDFINLLSSFREWAKRSVSTTTNQNLDQTLAEVVWADGPVHSIEKLVQAGADPCAEVKGYEMTSLMKALGQGRLYAVSAMLDHVQNPSLLRPEEVEACQTRCNLVMVRYHFVRLGIAPDMRDPDRSVCSLQAAAAEQILSCCEALIGKRPAQAVVKQNTISQLVAEVA